MGQAQNRLFLVCTPNMSTHTHSWLIHHEKLERHLHYLTMKKKEKKTSRNQTVEQLVAAVAANLHNFKVQFIRLKAAFLAISLVNEQKII